MITLTAAGIQLCTALLGSPQPATAFDDCVLAISRSQVICDTYLRCPEIMVSYPASVPPPRDEYNCEAIGRYDVDDGSYVTEYVCRREASLVWLPDGRWAWKWVSP